MTAISDGTAWWQLDKESLHAVLGRGEAERRRIYLESLEIVGELLSRTAGGKDEVAALCADLCASNGISRGEALRLIERAGLLGREKVRTAAYDDRLSPEHLAVIDKTIKAAPAAERDTVERNLLEQARNVDSAGMAIVGRRILQLLDQDGKAPNDRDLAEPRREFHYTARNDGTVAFRGSIDSEAGAKLAALISPLAKPTSSNDKRDTAQRQGDAFVEIIELAAGSEDVPGEGGERPHVAVTMSLETLTRQVGAASLEAGGYTDAASARRIACDCKVIPAVLGSQSDPLDFGRITRTIPLKLRRALILRDKGCAFPGCHRRPRQCDGHHVRHWADGGPTSLDNCVLLCGHHHRVIHHSEWEVVMAGGRPEFVPPPYLRHLATAA